MISKSPPHGQDAFYIILTLYKSLFKKETEHRNRVKTKLSLRGPYK
jgi:hypothetical protein